MAELANADSSDSFTAKAAEVLLDRVAAQQGQAFNAVGSGADLRFEANDLTGQALLVEGLVLHFSVFPRRPG